MTPEPNLQKLYCQECPTEIVVRGVELKEYGGIFCGNCGKPLGFIKDEGYEGGEVVR